MIFVSSNLLEISLLILMACILFSISTLIELIANSLKVVMRYYSHTNFRFTLDTQITNYNNLYYNNYKLDKIKLKIF